MSRELDEFDEGEQLRLAELRQEREQMRMERDRARRREELEPTLGDDCAELLEGWFKRAAPRGPEGTRRISRHISLVELQDLARKMRALGRG